MEFCIFAKYLINFIMKITQALFTSSGQRISDLPKRQAPEFAFIGRSNVGKSSLINMLVGKKNLAHTSSKPGKTLLINHFIINDQWYIVDLPGYGYAKVSKTMQEKISKIIRDYINLSKNMTLLFVLLDARHDIQQIDLDFLSTLGEAQIPFSIIFTKCDKLGPTALKTQIEKNKASLLEYWEELPPLFLSSAENKMGQEDILNHIDQILQEIDLEK